MRITLNGEQVASQCGRVESRLPLSVDVLREPQPVAIPSPLQCVDLIAFPCTFIVCFSPPDRQLPDSGSLLHALQGQVIAPRSMSAPWRYVLVCAGWLSEWMNCWTDRSGQEAPWSFSNLTPLQYRCWHTAPRKRPGWPRSQHTCHRGHCQQLSAPRTPEDFFFFKYIFKDVCYSVINGSKKWKQGITTGPFTEYYTDIK